MRQGIEGKLLAAIGAATIAAGCAVPTYEFDFGGYEAVTKTDEFSDARWCAVEPNRKMNRFLDEFFVTGVFRASFYAERRNGVDRVGIQTRGGFPAGEYQVRVDKHKAMILSYSDTPLDFVPPGLDMRPIPGMEGKEVTEWVKDFELSMQKMQSPYRAATGAKAKRLLNQIATGKVLKYRQVGVNIAGLAGEIELTDEPKAAIRKCWIKLGNE